MISSHICVNFRILGKNEDDWAKEEYTKLKRESWNAPSTHQSSPKTHLSQTLPKDLAQTSSISPKRDCSSDVRAFFVLLAQASPITPKREVT